MLRTTRLCRLVLWSGVLTSFLGVIGSPVYSADIRVKMTIRETGRLDRTNVAVSSGLPFAKGQWRGDDALVAQTTSGDALPAQFDVLSRWDDGSVKWVLVSVIVDSLKASEAFEFVLVTGRAAGEPAAKITNLGRALLVDYPKFSVTTNALGLPGNITFTEGGTRLGGPPELIVLGKSVPTDAVRVDDMRTEENGPIRTVVRTQGTFELGPDLTFGYIARNTIFANGQIDTSYTVINHQVNDFHGYGVKLPLPSGSTTARFGDVEVALTSAKGPFAKAAVGVRQNSAQNATAVGDGAPLKTTRIRYSGGVSVSGSTGRLGAAVRDFWQRYPSEVTADRQGVELWFYPNDPRVAAPVYRVGRAALGEFTIHIDGDVNESQLGRTDLHAFASPEWYLASGVLGKYTLKDFPLSKGSYHTYLNGHMEYLQMRKFEADEFGFWDFGDGAGSQGRFRRNNEFGISFAMLFHYLRTGDAVFFADGVAFAKHFRDVDTLHHGDMKGKSIRHTYSHVDGSDYDTAHQWTEGMLLQYVLTGDRRSLEVAREMGEHIVAWSHDLSPKLKAKPTTIPERVTERNLGWVLLSLMFLEDVTGEKQYTDAIRALIDGIVASQDLKRGHWPRVLPHPDFPNGGSTFMLGVLTEALLRYHEKTGDDAVANSIVRTSYWLSEEMWNPEVRNLRYKQWDRFWNHYNDGRTIPMVLPGMVYAEYLGRSDERYRDIVDGTLQVYDNSHVYDAKKFGEGRNYKTLGMMSRSMPRFFYYYEKVRGRGK